MSKEILNPEDVLPLSLTQKNKGEVHQQEDILLREKEVEELTVEEGHHLTDMKEEILLMRGIVRGGHQTQGGLQNQNMVLEDQREKETVQEGLLFQAPEDHQMQDITQIETAQEENLVVMGIDQDVILVVGKGPRIVGEEHLIRGTAQEDLQSGMMTNPLLGHIQEMISMEDLLLIPPANTAGTGRKTESHRASHGPPVPPQRS